MLLLALNWMELDQRINPQVVDSYVDLVSFSSSPAISRGSSGAIKPCSTLTHSWTIFSDKSLLYSRVINENHRQPLPNFNGHGLDRWRGGATGRALDLRSTVQVVGSNPTAGKSCVTTSGKLFTPNAPLLPSSITWYRSRGGDTLRLGR